MMKAIKARRAARVARAQLRMATLELLMAQNRRRLAELDALRECRWCKGFEPPEQRAECEVAAGGPSGWAARYRAARPEENAPAEASR